MSAQIPLDPDQPSDDGASEERVHEVAPDLAYRRLGIVNVAFYGRPGGDWVLIDAGVFGTMDQIVKAAEERFGKDARPSAIVLTHGHFDHVGVLEDLVDLWDVPVYAHQLERPYLDGSASYPPPDPSVGGLMARLSPLYPRSPVDVSGHLRTLPEDGSIPGMPGWRWLHTPGHCPGHVSFWREADRTIVAGDAFITTNQESAYAVALQKPEMHGPPQYLTIDWEAAGASVRKLAALEPELAVTGHGPALRGPRMRDALHALARDFHQVAVPEGGRYVGNPARAEDGSAYKSD